MEKYHFINDIVIKTGSRAVPLYIVIGETAVIIDGGILPDLDAVSRIVTALSDEVTISHWLITHAHYDHCGLLPYLRDLLPDCTVCGSSKSSESLSRQGVIEFVDARNRELHQDMCSSSDLCQQSLRKYRIDKIVEAGDEIDLGKGVRLMLINAIGHSPCSLAVWLPHQRMLFPSDALGSCLNANDIMPLIFYSYKEYLATNKRLARLDPEWVFLGHYALFYGSEAASLCDRAREDIFRFQNHYMSLERQIGQQPALTALCNQYYDSSAVFIRPDIFRASLERMCHLIKESL